ncbi:ABC transporter ATP-binding protein [Candidatus Harpocratesius sp.]
MNQISYEAELLEIKESWQENLLYSLKEIFMIYKSKYVETVALQNLNMKIFHGEILSIMGPSGSGKSSLLNILSGILSPTVGRVYFNQDIKVKNIIEIAKFDVEARTNFRRKNIGYVFQDPNLFEYLTVEENVQVPLLIQGKDVNDNHDWISEVLTSCGIEHRRSYKIEQLSGGERQRVQIACAIISRPKILIADEPTGNLDAANALKIFDLFRSINEKYSTTMVIATHDEKISKYATRKLVIENGSIK